MGKSLRDTCLVLAALAGSLASAEEPFALIHGRIVDVESGSVAEGDVIIVRDGRIESVAGAVPEGMRSVDLGGRYVIPGLIDAHVHISNLAAARRALESGVTTARSAGVAWYADVGLAKLVQQGVIAGPELVPAGYHVRPRLAEAAFIGDPDLAPLRDGIDTEEEVRRMVRANLERGARFVKVLATERAGLPDTDPRRPVFDEELLRAAVEEAAKAGVPVQAHAHGDEGARAAVIAGVKSIEHGTYLSEATLELMKERGTYLVPTYSIVTDLMEPGGDYDIAFLQVRGRHMLPRLAEVIRTAHRLGVPIVTGVDTGYGPESVTRIGHEIEDLASLGLSPAEALAAATTTAARLIDRSDSLGRIAPGFEADLVVLAGNPLEDVGRVQDVLLVVSNGLIAVDRLGLADR